MPSGYLLHTGQYIAIDAFWIPLTHWSIHCYRLITSMKTDGSRYSHFKKQKTKYWQTDVPIYCPQTGWTFLLTHTDSPCTLLLKGCPAYLGQCSIIVPLHYWMAHETLPPISDVCIMSRNCLFLLCAFAVGLEFFLQALVRCHRKQTHYKDFPSTFFLCPIFVLWLLLKLLCYSYLSFIFFRSSRLTFII